MNSPGVDLEDAKTIDDIARALVRPIVTVIFALAFTVFTFVGIVSGEVFASVCGMIFAFWFSSRNQEKTDTKASELQQAIIPAVIAQAAQEVVNEQRKQG